MNSVEPYLIIATRIHLGKQSTPPPQDKLNKNVLTFLQTASSARARKAVIAVDPEEKIQGYDLVSSIETALTEAKKEIGGNDNVNDCDCTILSVTPWGSFVPALNALTSWACKNQEISNDQNGKSCIVFLSAETSLTRETVHALNQHMTDDTLVVGAALPGHDFYGKSDDDTIGTEVDLNGRTCPWNTLAMWDLNKLALIGFPLCADGLHTLEDGTSVAGGIEEFATILLHQRVSPCGEGNSKAKLVKVAGVAWEQTFDDNERRKWHENKMKSKKSRAEVHRTLLGGGSAKAYHF